MIIKNKIEQNKEMKEIIELKNFKRHHFLDLNHAKEGTNDRSASGV